MSQPGTRRGPQRRRRLTSLLLGLLACACLDAGCGGAGDEEAADAGGRVAPEPPKLRSAVLITLDTTRADALGVYGSRLPTSPRIDALAAEGAVFEQAFASTPSTLPSHTTILTGKLPFAHGVRSNSGYVLTEENVTLAEVLRERGWRTHAEIAAPVIGRGRGLEQGFEDYRDPRRSKGVLRVFDEAEGRHYFRNERRGEEIADGGIAFLRAHAAEPFFLWLHFFDPHVVYDAPEPFASEIPSPYHAEVRYADHQVGRVLDVLDELGVADTTLVVVTADHGEGLGEHAEETHSYFVWDTTMRVPLVLRGGDLPRGERIRAVVRLADVAPTILDLLGQPPLEGVQGVSLRPLLEDPSEDPRLVAYGESIELMSTFGGDPLRFVRQGHWKYQHRLEPALHNLFNDPAERRNQAAERPDDVERLYGALEELLAAAPNAPEGAVVELDADDLEELRALGYVGAAPPPAEDLATLDLGGPDPSTQVDDVRLLAASMGHVSLGRYAEGRDGYRALYEKYPESELVISGLIRSLVALETPDAEVLPLLRRAVELHPESAGNRDHLATRLAARGETETAVALLRDGLLLDPCREELRLRLARVLHGAGRYREELEALEAACADSVGLRNALAYALATLPEDALRDGRRALELARVAVEESEARHPDYLDTLAAAHAELGDFESAVREQQRVMALLEGFDVPENISDMYRRHLEAYRQGRPVREP